MHCSLAICEFELVSSGIRPTCGAVIGLPLTAHHSTFCRPLWKIRTAEKKGEFDEWDEEWDVLGVSVYGNRRAGGLRFKLSKAILSFGSVPFASRL